MLYGALELAAKILGICEEYEAQAINCKLADHAHLTMEYHDTRGCGLGC